MAVGSGGGRGPEVCRSGRPGLGATTSHKHVGMHAQHMTCTACSATSANEPAHSAVLRGLEPLPALVRTLPPVPLCACAMLGCGGSGECAAPHRRISTNGTQMSFNDHYPLLSSCETSASNSLPTKQGAMASKLFSAA